MDIKEEEYRVVVKRWSEDLPDKADGIPIEYRSEEWFRASDGASTRLDGQPSFGIYNNETNYAYLLEWRDDQGRLHNPNPEHLDPARITAGPIVEQQFFIHGKQVGVLRSTKTEFNELDHEWRVEEWGDYEELPRPSNDTEPAP